MMVLVFGVLSGLIERPEIGSRHNSEIRQSGTDGICDIRGCKMRIMPLADACVRVSEMMCNDHQGYSAHCEMACVRMAQGME